MAKKQQNKGRPLERAVRLIQQSLLDSDPKLKGTRFSIQANHVAVVDGVRHEIDLLVTTLPGSPFECTSIFECKDWRKPVTKNEVIVLARKVELLRANRGFLVARRITRDAEAQISIDKRLRFLHCTDEFLAPFSNIELTHVSHDLLPIRIYVKERGAPPKLRPELLDWRNARPVLDGRPIDFLSFIRDRVDELVKDDRQHNSSRYRQQGTHPGRIAVEIIFAPRELTIGDLDAEKMSIELQFFVTVRKPKIISKFEVTGQGRTFSFEPIETDAGTRSIEIDLVQRL